MCLRFLLELMCRLLAFHRLILPDPNTLKRFLAEDLVLMVLFVVRVRVGESVVAVGNCAVVRWTRDDSLGANRANNMFVVCCWGMGWVRRAGSRELVTKGLVRLKRV